MKSVDIAVRSKKKDYVWDYAGHFFHFSTDEFKKRFIDSVDEDEIIYKR